MKCTGIALERQYIAMIARCESVGLHNKPTGGNPAFSPTVLVCSLLANLPAILGKAANEHCSGRIDELGIYQMPLH